MIFYPMYAVPEAIPFTAPPISVRAICASARTSVALPSASSRTSLHRSAF